MLAIVLARTVLPVALLVSTPAQGREVAPPEVLLRNASLVDVEAGCVTVGMSVLIRDGRIVTVAPDGSIRASAGARVIDVGGRYVLPGLVDMHVHVPEISGTTATGDGDPPGWRYLAGLSLAHGVTSARLPGGDLASLRRMRERLQRGASVGPRIWITGGKLGQRAVVPGAPFPLQSPADAERSVQLLKDQGADFVKVEFDLPPELWRAAAHRGRQLGLPIVGHVPMGLEFEEAIDSGQRSVEHLFRFPHETSGLEELMEQLEDPTSPTSLYERVLVKARLRPRPPPFQLRVIDSHSPARRSAVLAHLRNSGTAVVPTLGLHAGIEKARDRARMRERAGLLLDYGFSDLVRSGGGLPADSVQRRTFAFYEHLVGELHRANVSVLAGSDAPTLNVPGLALHDELGWFVRAGMTPAQALRAATIESARFLGADSIGVVRAGALADLVIVRDNPLDDVAATRGIAFVVSRGRVFDRTALDAMLADAAGIAERHRAARRREDGVPADAPQRAAAQAAPVRPAPAQQARGTPARTR